MQESKSHLLPRRQSAFLHPLIRSLQNRGCGNRCLPLPLPHFSPGREDFARWPVEHIAPFTRRFFVHRPKHPNSRCRFSILGRLLLAIPLATGVGCATGHNLAGVRHYEQGQYDVAIQRFQKAVEANPANADGYYNLAATFHQLGKQRNDPQMLQQAETFYNRCLDFEKDHVDCHRALGVLLVETGRPEKQFALLKNWAARSPQFAEARIELARAYEEYGDPETAKRYLEEAVAMDVTNSRAWTALGQLRESSGDLTQALADYQRAYGLNNYQPGLTHKIASLQKNTPTTSGNFSTLGGTRTVNGATSTIR